jgi:hypothetical protein
LAGIAQPGADSAQDRIQTVLPLTAFAPVFGSARSVPAYPVANAAWTSGEPLVAAVVVVVAAAADPDPFDEELLLPHAATTKPITHRTARAHAFLMMLSS